MPSITNTDAEQIRWISTVQSSVHINTVYLPSHLLDLTCIEHHGTIPDSFQVPHGLTCIQYTHSARREFPSWARPAALCIHGRIFKISRHQRADDHTWEARGLKRSWKIQKDPWRWGMMGMGQRFDSCPLNQQDSILKMDHRRHCQDISRSFQIPCRDLPHFGTCKAPQQNLENTTVAYTGTYSISQHQSLLKKQNSFL